MDTESFGPNEVSGDLFSMRAGLCGSQVGEVRRATSALRELTNQPPARRTWGRQLARSLPQELMSVWTPCSPGSPPPSLFLAFLADCIFGSCSSWCAFMNTLSVVSLSYEDRDSSCSLCIPNAFLARSLHPGVLSKCLLTD